VNDDTTVRKPGQTAMSKLLDRFDFVTEHHRQVNDLVAQKITTIPGSSEISPLTSTFDGTAGINPSSPTAASLHHKSTASFYEADHTLISNVKKTHYPSNESGIDAVLHHNPVQQTNSFTSTE
jgi:hypothetical protein